MLHIRRRLILGIGTWLVSLLVAGQVLAKEEPVVETPPSEGPGAEAPLGEEPPVAEEQPPTEERLSIVLSEGKITLSAPVCWEQVEPQNNIIDCEFSIAPADGQAPPARLTIMGAGGTREANIDRWVGQFTQPDGRSTRDRTTSRQLPLEQTVYLVNITGTFRDQRGPYAPAVLREDYRMLAAIIQTEERGQYFVKLVGERRIIADNEALFLEMLETLHVE